MPAMHKCCIRDLKILDAAALKNAVTSERAWVVTATTNLKICVVQAVAETSNNK